MKRRTFLSGLAATSSLTTTTALSKEKTNNKTSLSDCKVLSPPVVQNPTETSFSVSWMISGKATGWVEWGTSKDLGHKATPAHHGLMSLSEYVLSASITNIPAGSQVFYRVVTMPIHYNHAYSIEKGTPIVGEIRQLKLPKASADTCSLAMVNDTHDHEKTISSLATRINQLDPDALIWNGDACDTFETPQQTARICLTPGQSPSEPAHGGWASTRPLFFTLGNHDARGVSARTLPEVITPWPLDHDDPAGLAPTPYAAGRYCFAKRIGPVAVICLDTGEDKPDRRDVWGGMAAYEPYREAQRKWLLQALQQPEITSAPYLITFCHIPLRGLPGDNDGMGDTGYAGYSGFGQKLWLQPLLDAGCQMILSGHTHQHRIDKPSKEFPIYQVVGGGPKTNNTSLVFIRADKKNLQLSIENIDQKEVAQITLPPRKV